MVGFLLVWLLIVYTQVLAFVFLERKSPTQAFGWLLLLLVLPVISFFLYFIMRRGGIRTAHSNNPSKPSVATDQSVELFFEGNQLYPHLFQRLQNAKQLIHISFFIIRDDPIGEKLQQILIDKARSGCKIRLLYDAVGSHGLSKKYIQELKVAGINISAFSPLKFPWITGLNRRYHRKIVVIDNEVAYIGGFNIGKEYMGKDPKMGYWRDSHAVIRGGSVLILQQLFYNDWYKATGQRILHELPNLERSKHISPPFETNTALLSDLGKIRTEIVWSGPTSLFPNCLHQVLSFLYAAKEYVWIATPYLVPDQTLLTVLQARALAGIEIKIMLPQKADHLLVYFASHSFIEQLLTAGVEIYLFDAGFMHSKLMIADDTNLIIGSSNFDMRSFFLNYELNAIMSDPNTALNAKLQYEHDLQLSHKIDIVTFKHRGFGKKAIEAIARLFAPMM